MSKAILTNNEIALIMECQTECKDLPGYRLNFWRAMETIFDLDRVDIWAAIQYAKVNGMRVG